MQGRDMDEDAGNQGARTAQSTVLPDGEEGAVVDLVTEEVSGILLV